MDEVDTYATMSRNFIVDNNAGISGSLTNLVDGTSYLVAGANVVITSQSNGSVLIAAIAGNSTTYGNGADGNTVITGSTTLTRDMYYASLTVNSGESLFTNGYRVFVSGSCLVSGTISNDGGVGGAGGVVGGLAGAAGTLGGGAKGGGTDSGAASITAGVMGVNAKGGTGNPASGPNQGGGYTSVWQLNTLGANNFVPDSVEEIVVASAGTFLNIQGGAGGGGGSTGGNDGAGGGGGGVVALIAHDLTVASGGTIHADGGSGGAGSGSDHGAGGGGGLVIIVTQSPLVNSGSIHANGGAGGSGAASGNAGAVYTYTLN
jgi:hypothetical protein